MSDEKIDDSDKVTLILPCNRVCEDLPCDGFDDVSLQNLDHQLQVSKKNLARHSPYFEAMFFGGFSEGTKSHVKIEGVKCSALQKIVALTSEDSIDFALDYGTVFHILEAASMLQFSSIQKQCCDFLITSMVVDNVIEILIVAEHLSIHNMYSKAFGFTLYHFERVIHSQSFLNLEAQTLKKIVNSSQLKVSSEVFVFEAIMKWVKYDEPSRHKYLPEIAEFIRTGELSKQQLKELKLDDASNQKHKSQRKVPKYPCCIGRFKKSPYIFIFDTETSSLQPFLSLSGKVTSIIGQTKNSVTACGFQAGSTGTAIYILGGEFSLGRGNWNTEVWKYDSLTEEWENIFKLENPRRHHSLAFDEDHFYIIGGFGKHRVKLDTLDCFKEEKDQITTHSCASLPDPSFSMATFCHEGKLYTLKSQFDSLVYDPANDRWSKAFSHINFPAGNEFNFAFPYKNDVYLTTRRNSKLYRFAMTPNENTYSGEPMILELTLVGEFQQETQNVCIIDSVIFNFSSDQFAYYSTIESYDIEDGSFDMLLKTEDEGLDFSPYFSFGCFPLVKYPNFKL